ncbi:hypothetical protein [Kitasatospora sp. NPDC059327]|uniref:hypothetical protein n=1 Tax=Kitasatospora sp. NPDC059327 TaxID=3346803 RepID=UPI0036CD1760
MVLLLEEVFEEYGEPLVILRTNGLHYLVQAQEELRPLAQRLCTFYGCRQEALSYSSHLTRVCEEHLDVRTDLVESDDPATVRAARLGERTRITTEAQALLAGDIRHAEPLRAAG